MLIGAAFFAAVIAVFAGPLELLVRAGLRLFCGRQGMLRWQRPVSIGVAVGLILSPLVAGVVAGVQPVTVVVLGLLILLGGLDLAWRWLPYEWTIPLLALGLIEAFHHSNVDQAVLGAVTGGGFLFALQMSMKLLRGQDGLGTGDIWLAAGLGTFVGPHSIIFVLAGAAITGILAHSLVFQSEKPRSRKRLGVAYGAHLCLVFAIFRFVY